MRSSKVTCDRCGVEASENVQIERYSARCTWGGYQDSINCGWDLCRTCRTVVDAILSGVANSIVIKKEVTDGN